MTEVEKFRAALLLTAFAAIFIDEVVGHQTSKPRDGACYYLKHAGCGH